MNEASKVQINLTDETAKYLVETAKQQHTSPGDIIGMALALFAKAQGRQVVIKEKNSDTELQIDTFKDNPVQKGL